MKNTSITGTAIVQEQSGGNAAGVQTGPIENATFTGPVYPGTMSPHATPEVLEETRVKYLQFVIEDCGRLEPRGIPQNIRSITLPLDEIYVSLSAEQEGERSSESQLKDEKEDSAVRVTRKPSNRPLKQESTTQIETLPQVVASNAQVILLGKPGAGKTTLTRFLAAQFALSCQEQQPHVTDKDGYDYGETRLPIRIRIAEYADAYRKKRSLPLRKFLSPGCHHAQNPEEKISALFENALNYGTAFILLDGLDEVADSPTRTQVARNIETFLSDLEPGNRVLVTSRTVGYSEARLDSRMTPFTLQDMNRSQIERFLERWCIAAERFHAPDSPVEMLTERGNAERDALLKAIDSNAGVHRLAVNPLLITILALIHRNHTRLPEHRIGLYKTATETLLRGWRVAQAGQEGDEITEGEEQSLLWPLALWMHRTRDTGRVEKDELLPQLRKIYAEMLGRKSHDREIIDGVRDFLKKLSEQSGIFVPYPPTEYGFLHLTFQEYLAGQALVCDFQTAAREIAALRHQARWEEPIRLAIASQTAKNAANLIRNAIWCSSHETAYYHYVPSPHEDILHRDLLFAARCLGDCTSIEPTLAREIADELVNICLTRSEDGTSRSLFRQVRDTLEALRTTSIGTYAIEAFIYAIKDDDQYTRWMAIQALGQIGHGSQVALNTIIHAIKSEDRYTRMEAADALGQIGEDSKVVLDAVIQAIKDKDENVRSIATTTFGQIGKKSQAALNIIIHTVKDKNKYVRRAAIWALKQIGEESQAILDAIICATKDEDEIVRRTAVEALGQTSGRSQGALDAIIYTIKDIDEYVRRTAAWTLGQIGKGSQATLNAIIHTTKDEDEDVRWAAVSALGQIGEGSQAALEAIIQATKDEDEDVRKTAAEALGQIGGGSQAALEAITRAIKDQDEDVSWAAAEALEQIGKGSQDALNAIIHTTKDEDEDVRWAAVSALGQIGGGSQAALEAIIQATKDEDEDVRRTAVETLGQIGKESQAALDTITQSIKVEEVDVRKAAAKALGQIGQSSQVALNAIIHAIGNDEDEDVRKTSIKALGYIGQESQVALDIILHATQDEDDDVRRIAVEVLGHIGKGSQVALDAIIYATEDEDENVRRTAIETLGQIGQGSQVALDAIIFVSECDEDEIVRMAAIESIGQIGQGSQDALDAIIYAAEDEDENVRRTAIETLGQIGKGSQATLDAISHATKDEDEYMRDLAWDTLSELAAA